MKWPCSAPCAIADHATLYIFPSRRATSSEDLTWLSGFHSRRNLLQCTTCFSPAPASSLCQAREVTSIRVNIRRRSESNHVRHGAATKAAAPVMTRNETAPNQPLGSVQTWAAGLGYSSVFVSLRKQSPRRGVVSLWKPQSTNLVYTI